MTQITVTITGTIDAGLHWIPKGTGKDRTQELVDSNQEKIFDALYENLEGFMQRPDTDVEFEVKGS
jgi:hypothetical protein